MHAAAALPGSHGAGDVALADLRDVRHRFEGVHLAAREHGGRAEPADVRAEVEHAHARPQVGEHQVGLVIGPRTALDRGADDGVAGEDLEVDPEALRSDRAGGGAHGR